MNFAVFVNILGLQPFQREPDSPFASVRLIAMALVSEAGNARGNRMVSPVPNVAV